MFAFCKLSSRPYFLTIHFYLFLFWMYSSIAAARGDLAPITGWLREKVHQYGGLMEPADVVKNACGDFSPEDYIQYLTRKYTELYGL